MHFSKLHYNISSKKINKLFLLIMFFEQIINFLFFFNMGGFLVALLPSILIWHHSTTDFQEPKQPKNRLFALRYRSSASLASLSPVDCFAGATILATFSIIQGLSLHVPKIYISTYILFGTCCEFWLHSSST